MAVTLSGMVTLEQVQQNIASASRSGVGRLHTDELALIDQAREAIKAQSPIPCTACEYCLPCPNDVNIPRNFEFYNQAAMDEDIHSWLIVVDEVLDLEKPYSYSLAA